MEEKAWYNGYEIKKYKWIIKINFYVLNVIRNQDTIKVGNGSVDKSNKN